MKNLKCQVCNLPTENPITFSCEHNYCQNCFYLVILHNKKEIYKLPTRINLSCIKCNHGKHDINKNDLLDTNKASTDINYKTISDSKHNIHMSDYLKNINNTEKDVCHIHLEEGEPYYFICLDCNYKICKLCYQNIHQSHTVRVIAFFHNENVDKALLNFPWKDEHEINDYFGSIFEREINMLTEDKVKISYDCDRISAAVSEIKFKMSEENDIRINDTRKVNNLLKTYYNKYFSQIRNRKNFPSFLDLSFNKENDFATSDQDCKLKSELNDMLASLTKLKEVYFFEDTNINNNKLSKFECSNIIKNSSIVRCLLELKDGNIVSGSDDGIVRIYNAKDNYSIEKELEGHSAPVTCLVQIPNTIVISGSEDKNIFIWDDFKCSKVLRGHTEAVKCFLYLPQYCYLLSGSSDKTIRIWNAATKVCDRMLEGHKQPVNYIMALRNGNLISASGDTTMRVWEVPRFVCIKVVEGHSHSVNYLAELDDGYIASASSDKTIRIWDTDFKCLNVFEAHLKAINCVIGFGRDMILTCSGDSTLKVWNIKQKNKCERVVDHNAGSINIALMAGDKILTAGSDKSMRIYV
jgi:WD40 repeat protein